MTQQNALVTVKTAPQNAIDPRRDIRIFKKSAVPASIKDGILDLVVAFPAGPKQEPADQARQLRLYAEACDGFEVCIVSYVLRNLPFHNPRNPFLPTPQDVRELCNRVRNVWIRRVNGYFLGRNYEPPGKWGPPTYSSPSSDWWANDWGSPPGDASC